ncbi:ubiquinol-cytochrome-c reductase complex assembly factor 1-like [Liolophura sinensis]|uniref:ubiquinol-cytochrome-c reductase complex assembly factor 1-like n=1 Tax=Liolophura sinensis TaxID=3198878 RepID=UPI0031594F7E
MMTARCSTVVLRTGLNVCRQDDVACSMASQLRLISRLHSLPIRLSRSTSCTMTRNNTQKIQLEENMWTHQQSLVQRMTHCHRCYSSGTLVNTAGSGGLFGRIKKAVGLKEKATYRYPRTKMAMTGFKLFRNCSELIDYEEFFEVFDMPDTFNSWFLVMELHVWMYMVRLAAEGADGKYVRNSLVEMMWKDVEERIKMIGGGARRSYLRDSLESLGGHFRMSLYAYDEGLLSHDRVLAGALWRIFFEKADTDPGSLARMVEYVRQQIHALDSADSERLLCHGDVRFLPLSVEKGVMSQNRRNSTQ